MVGRERRGEAGGARRQRLADRGAADDRLALTQRGKDPQAEAQLLAQCFQHLDVARAVVAQGKALAHPEFHDGQRAHQFGQERARILTRDLAGVVDDHRLIETQRVHLG